LNYQNPENSDNFGKSSKFWEFTPGISGAVDFRNSPSGIPGGPDFFVMLNQH